MGNVGKLSVKLMLTVLTNLTPDLYMWTCTIWVTSFVASRKWSGSSEQVFINQLNFRPTSIGKHNSTGHLLPCAIDFKTNPPPYICNGLGYLAWQLSRAMLFQWGLANRKSAVMQLSAATSSVWRTLFNYTWWRPQMETFSALLAICAGNSPRTKTSDEKLWCFLWSASE